MSATVVSSSFSNERPPLDQNALQLDAEGQFTSFGHYINAKVNKLIRQVHNGAEHTSQLFKGISFYVNGYTNPPALELREIIIANGGEYHHYYFHGTTTYTVACNLSVSKWSSLRTNEKVIRPEWITECVKAGELLHTDAFLLRQFNPTTRSVVSSALSNGRAPPTMASVSQFYQRSRLHLISTLAQELKTFVGELRRTSNRDFPSRKRLLHLSQSAMSDGINVKRKPVICHIDMDCFFVAVALRNRPDLIGKPVAITHSKTNGDSGGRGGYGEIASCSYEARACGVKSSMLVNRAIDLCPSLICLPYQFDDYRETSKLLYTTVANYTLDIRAVSCDEMYVNLTGLCTDMRICDVAAVVAELRREVLQVTQCNASAGIGSNVLLARLATKKAKPNGHYWVREADVDAFMASFSLRDLPGVGYAMEYRLREAFGDDELSNCRQIQRIPLARLQTVCGEKIGLKIYESCRGICKDELEIEFLDATSTRKSVSCDVNFGIRMTAKEELWKFFDDVGAQLASKLDTLQTSGSALTLKLMIRAPEAPLEPKKYGAHGLCNNVSKTFIYAEPTCSAGAIASGAKRLAAQLAPVISDIRGIGLQMTRLNSSSSTLSLKLKEQTSHKRDAAQPSIKDFLRVRTTPSPNICEQLSRFKSDDKMDRANTSISKVKATARPTLKSAWSAFSIPKSTTTSRTRKQLVRPAVKTVECHQPQAADVKKASRVLSKTTVTTAGNSLLFDDISVDYTREPDSQTVSRLERLFVQLIEEFHFRKAQCFYSFFCRNIANRPDAHAGWTDVVTALHTTLNTISIVRFGVIILR